jgi:outer membrane protein OmpA-like peptidoglycan-associated protein
VRFGDGYRLLVIVTPLVIGCVDSVAVQQRVDRVREMIDESRNSGAYQCAPRDLALAVAHVEFSENELTDGDLFWALRHLDEAELHATDAAKRSESPACFRSASDEQQGESERGRLISGAFERGTERCRYRDSSGVWVERQGACPNLQDADGVETAESKDGRAEGRRDRDRYVGRDRKSEAQEQMDNQCLSETGQRVNAVCLEKYKYIEITVSAIRLKKSVLFKERQAKIAPESYSTLDEIAHFLISNPPITVEIQGHTDSAGDDTFNLRFSQKRAESVRGYLINKGIAPSRLVARGYGETSPIESNHTSRGRAANRRIEIIRTD